VSRRRYRAEPGDHLVWLNYKDVGHPLCGGAEEFMHQVAARLVQQGQRVTIITARSRGAARVETIRGATVRRMGNTWTVYLLALIWLFRHRERIDGIVDTCNGIPFFSPVAVRRRVPVLVLIHHVHQVMFAQHFRFPLAQLGRWIERAGNRYVYGDRTIAVVSPSSRAEVRHVLGLTGPVFVAANGQQHLAAPGATRSPAPRIVCVGRLAPHKRWDLLLRIMPRVIELVPDVELELIGDGPCRGRLERLAAELGLADHVRLLGRLPDAERNRRLATAWVTVCTSQVEGWGLAVTEAMSLGVPAVVLASPGLRDAVRDRHTGWVVERAQHLAGRLTSALIELEDPEVAAGYAANCRAWVGRFTWEAAADRMAGLLVNEDARRIAADRRAICDLSTVVELPVRQAALVDFARLRTVDQVDWDEPEARDPKVRLLLAGYDEEDAAALMRRCGVDTSAMRAWIARPSDLLGWRRTAGPRSRELSDLFARRAS
jgi:glycosyltransferase involved in cell wall biosynthesis